jgi:aminopeptidase-like protein
LPEGEYRVRVDTSLEEGCLTYGEVALPGSSDDFVLLSTHVCHPSLCNDNLSGLAVVATVGRVLAGCERRYGHRLLFVPGTIGAITWLARNREAVDRVRAGLVAANLGDAGGFHYKRSRRGDASIDRLVERTLRARGGAFEVEEFVPFGYDERQYCSPGFDLPVGSLTRTPWGRYPEYHTSADDPSLVTPARLAESLRLYLEILAGLEEERRFRNLAPEGEPQLGRRGLYRTLGGDDRGRERELAMLWVLNQSNGEHSLRDVAERSGLDEELLAGAADALLDAELLVEL